ncbi:MAG: hypothetical protein PHV06_03880, partial [bacterium]|nr:hypothetical protein [bacterium]
KEKIKINDESLHLIAEKSEGSMRDAEVLLDQLVSSSEKEITPENIRQLFGMVDYMVLYDFLKTFLNRDLNRGLAIINDIFVSGNDIAIFLEDLLLKIRNIILFKVNPDSESRIYVTEREKVVINELASKMDISFLSAISQKFLYLINSTKYSSNPRVLFELNYVQMLNIQPHISLEEIMKKLEALSGKGIIIEDSEEDHSDYETEKISEKPVTENSDNDSSSEPEDYADNDTSEDSEEQTETLPFSEKPDNSKSSEKEKAEEKSDLDWKGFMKFIEDSNISVSMYLKGSFVYQDTPQMTTIAFSQRDKFKREYLDRLEKKKLVEELFEKYFKVKKDIKFIVKGETVVIEDQKEKLEIDKKEIENEIEAKEPIVKTTIEMLQGTIKDIKIK